MEEKKKAPTCYELTLTTNYVANWTFNDAIRELIQNGIDQEVLDTSNKFELVYNEDEEKLLLISPISKLSINTLLLGRSSKADNEDTVGQFGEGYKIASLVLNREGKTFTIYNNNNNQLWTSRFKNSKKWRDKILAFYVGDNITNESGLVVEVGNVSMEEYLDIKEVWLNFNGEFERLKNNNLLVETTYGELILDEDYKGLTFVNGLSISCGSNFKYGYNFKSKYITLERDRKSCDSWNAESITSKMMNEAIISDRIDFEEIETLVGSYSSDVYQSYNFKEGVKDRFIESFDIKNVPKIKDNIVVPISSEEERKKVLAYGGEPIFINSRVHDILKDEKDRRIELLSKREFKDELSLREKFQRWYDIYSSELNNEAKEELAELINKI